MNKPLDWSLMGAEDIYTEAIWTNGDIDGGFQLCDHVMGYMTSEEFDTGFCW